MQGCAKIRVNKYELAKKRIAILSDVCIFFFWWQRHLQMPAASIILLYLNIF